MSDVVAVEREPAPKTPAPSSTSSQVTEEGQGQLLEKGQPAAKPGAATTGPAAELPTLKAGPRPWEDPLKEARWSVQSLDSHIKSEISGKQPDLGPTLADAGSRVKAALEDVWKDPNLSSTLKAQGETPESIKKDLSAGHFDKVVATLQKTETSLNEAHRQGLELPPAVSRTPANDVGKVEPANTTPAAATTAKTPTPVTTRAGDTVQQDPIVELIQRLQGASVSLTERDAGLARGINKLAETASADSSATSQATFRTHVAYSLQDTEKALGSGSVPVPAELRSEMTRLAGSSPGLENKQMENLVRSTPSLDDRGLVRDLRRAADSIASLGSNQNSPAVQQHVEVLENRVRLAARVTVSEAVSPQGERLVPTGAEATTATGAPGKTPSPIRTTTNLDSATVTSPASDRTHEPEKPGQPGTVRTAESPGDRQHERGSMPDRREPGAPARSQASIKVNDAKPKTAMAQIMDNLRSPGPSSPPPWAPSAFAMGERVSKFEQMMGHGKTDQLIRASEKSGVAMMKAVETFSTGPGAEILGKIDAAAGTEPGGMKAVMREMQPGGRYAELRSQFDNALQSDKVFAASYSQVEKTAEQHGKDRLALGADFQAKGLETRQLDARFQKADEAIGEATERIPGRTPGKSVMEELGQKVAEIFNKAVERVRAMFGREAAPEARPSASPGMSP